MSQSKLSEVFNISQQAVSHYEKGLRDMDSNLISSLSTYFDVTIDYLLGKSDIRNYDKIEKEPTIALHSDYEYDELPDEVKNEIENFIEYVKTKYKK
ncbi:helix-turn-helix transcriptional regulator [uncultured Clostridium sp.]|uniref:helix-turn-helix domain-containing protein n=1 Tax=uncultured Clostridium sp. TaxID=59620 RepID=UPI0025EA9B81|nr:helix-turn-helix transcriptional regulator [uncultured Clostridium sp.]